MQLLQIVHTPEEHERFSAEGEGWSFDFRLKREVPRKRKFGFSHAVAGRRDFFAASSFASSLVWSADFIGSFALKVLAS
jgi:hypothetical protein